MSQSDLGSSQLNLNAAPFQPGALRLQASGQRSTREFNPDAAPFTPSSALSGPADSSNFVSVVPVPTDSKSIPLLGGYHRNRGPSTSPENGGTTISAALSNSSHNSPTTMPAGPPSTAHRITAPSDEASIPPPPPRSMPINSWAPPQLHKTAALRPTTGPTGADQTPGNPVSSATTPSVPAPASQHHSPHTQSSPLPASGLTVPMPRTAYAQLANASASTGESLPMTAAPAAAAATTDGSLDASAARAAPPAPRSRPGLYPASMASRTPAPRSQATAAAAVEVQAATGPPPATTSTTQGSGRTFADPAAPRMYSPPPPMASAAPGVASYNSQSMHGEVPSPAMQNPSLVPRPAAPATAPIMTWMPPQHQRVKPTPPVRHEDPVAASTEPDAAATPASSQPASTRPQAIAEAPPHRPPPAPRSTDGPGAAAVGSETQSLPATSALPPRIGSAPLVKSFTLPDPFSRVHRQAGLSGGAGGPGLALPSRPPAAAAATSTPSTTAASATSAKRDEPPVASAHATPTPAAARPPAPAPRPTAMQAAPPANESPAMPTAHRSPDPQQQQTAQYQQQTQHQVPTPQPAYPQQTSRPVAMPSASLRSHVGATPYAPQSWVPPQPHRLASRVNLQPSPTTPLVVLILGNRGSGKTTQGQALASRYNLLHLSSGNLFRDGKQPYKELEAVVKKHFMDPSKCTFNGLVLDRFIVSSAADAFFVQHALNFARLPVPIVFWLKVDPAVGLQRAAAQSTSKHGHDHWRLVEQCAQAAVVHQIYEPMGRVLAIDTQMYTQEEVGARIARYIDAQFARHWQNRSSLPSISPIPTDPRVAIMDDHASFMQLTHHVHGAIDSRGRHDSAPLSAIAGYVDETFFQDNSIKAARRAYYVTAKVDGHRFLVVKHRDYGFVGMPAVFNSCFDFNSLFEGHHFSTPAAKDLWPPTSEDNPVEVLLDTELAVDANGFPTLHVIDYVYFYGNIASRQVFQVRYDKLKRWFANMSERSSPDALARHSVVLKPYVPIRDLRKMLPSLSDTQVRLDGIVFQHNKKYIYGLDKALLKWKPQSQCTADFRLANGQLQPDGTWRFDLNVSVLKDAQVMSESPYPGATALVTEQERVLHHLQNAVVVELSLENLDQEAGESQWRFCRVRSDKPSPNKYEIVNYILSLKHLTYERLTELCAAAK